MSSPEGKTSFLNDQLSRHTSILGLKLWVVLGICIGTGLVVVLILLSIWFTSKRTETRTADTQKKTADTQKKLTFHTTHEPIITHDDTLLSPANISDSHSPEPSIPAVSREITEIRIESIQEGNDNKPNLKLGPDTVTRPGGSDPGLAGRTDSSSYGSGGNGRSGEQAGVGTEVAANLGWGQWYSLRELEESTNGFAEENVIGEGGYGIVYRGVLVDGTLVAVKNLLNNKGQAEKEFRVEVEAIGRVRHKNLVRLIGYCVEGAHRILVYEYVDNGNLEQWLHGDVGPHSPMTWEIRMNIIVGTAKGLTYLHEGLEPKVVHRDIKSSNILLDKQWNSKVSDFGLAKLLGSERNYVTTRVMGTFGYVAPEYASTGMLNERSDVYSFGILLMEIISGRSPVDYSRPPGEVNLVDWLKMMVSKRMTEGVLDPKLIEKPNSRSLKRALLVALRCVDPDAKKRPKMGQVVHMLEAEEFPFRDDRRAVQQDHGHPNRKRLMEKQFVAESGDSSGYESGVQNPTLRLPWKNHEPEERSLDAS